MSIEHDCLDYIQTKYKNLLEMSHTDFGYQQPYIERELYDLLSEVRSNRQPSVNASDLDYLFGQNQASYSDAYDKAEKEVGLSYLPGFHPPFFPFGS